MNQISDYGLIGNTRTAALVSKDGSIDWCCFPRFDSGSFFGQLLDPQGGHFKICPVGDYESLQKYLEDTNVLETTFMTSTGEVRILDSFTVASEDDKCRELMPTHEILRVVECVSGSVLMTFSFHPAPGFGKTPYRLRDTQKLGLRCDFGSETVVLLHDVGSNKEFMLQKNQKHIFSLSYNTVAPGILPCLGESALERLDRTISYWRSWIEQCSYEGEYNKEVRRSALALKLLVFSPSGAIIAAPTTSLPENIGGERNWDYRFCWLRDAAFTIRSFLALGLWTEARAYMGWILHSTALSRPRLKVLYTVYGEDRIPERKIGWFSGYKDSRPVRVGNGADVQFQLDVYGEVMDAAYAYSECIEKFDHDSISFLKGIADSVCDLWNKPDNGIWEVRSDRVHHTHSKAMAALALNRFVRLAKRLEWKCSIEKYETIYQKIITDIERHGFSKKLNSYIRDYDGNQLDGSLLILSILTEGLSKERLTSTTHQVLEELGKTGLTYRYRNVADGLEGGEGTFIACSFWMVEALCKSGDIKKAKELMDEILRKDNSLGLWPEEMDPEDNEFLGNYPQAFSHTALISAALSLQEKSA